MPFDAAKGSVKAAFSASDRAPPQEVKVNGRSAARANRPPTLVRAPAAAAVARNVRLRMTSFTPFACSGWYDAGMFWLPPDLHLRPAAQVVAGDLSRPEADIAVQAQLKGRQLAEIDEVDDLGR